MEGSGGRGAASRRLPLLLVALAAFYVAHHVGVTRVGQQLLLQTPGLSLRARAAAPEAPSPYVAICLAAKSAFEVVGFCNWDSAACAACAAAAAALSATRSPCLHPKRLPADEWAELPEWVEHHLSVGVGKLYIMDDGSQASPECNWGGTQNATGWGSTLPGCC